MKKTLFAVLLLSLLIIFSGTSAFASITAKATATFTGLPSVTGGITAVSGSESITTDEYAWTFNPYVSNASGGYSQNDWTNTFSSSIAVGTSSTATSSFNGTALKAYSTSGPTGVDQPKSELWASMFQQYTYNASSRYFSVSIPYELIVDLTSVTGGLWAYGYAEAEIQVIVHHVSPYLKDSVWSVKDFVSGEVVGTGNIYQTANLFTLAIDGAGKLYTGDSISIYYNLYSTTSGASAVPVPAALWLLGSGLVGLVGIRRKIRK